jgi:hypothetical protein
MSNFFAGAISCRLLACMFALAASTCHAQDVSQRRNWFDDPFFQVTSGIPRCPVPAGPRITETERRSQAHHRVERGTSCWLAGECERPNAYAYDQDIARNLKAALPAAQRLSRSSLWVTVQRRIVFIEGCADRMSTASKLGALAKAVPDVQQVVLAVSLKPGSRPPYQLLSAP